MANYRDTLIRQLHAATRVKVAAKSGLQLTTSYQSVACGEDGSVSGSADPDSRILLATVNVLLTSITSAVTLTMYLCDDTNGGAPMSDVTSKAVISGTDTTAGGAAFAFGVPAAPMFVSTVGGAKKVRLRLKLDAGTAWGTVKAVFHPAIE